MSGNWSNGSPPNRFTQSWSALYEAAMTQSIAAIAVSSDIRDAPGYTCSLLKQYPQRRLQFSVTSRSSTLIAMWRGSDPG